ncbi:hypothetical protein ACFQBS_19600 [Planomonospora parontospora]|uniref:hypothetical protein n=1 Tax=Planomonospora parontospora TaxID=58119 RepID=UPI003620A5A5
MTEDFLPDGGLAGTTVLAAMLDRGVDEPDRRLGEDLLKRRSLQAIADLVFVPWVSSHISMDTARRMART